MDEDDLGRSFRCEPERSQILQRYLSSISAAPPGEHPSEHIQQGFLFQIPKLAGIKVDASANAALFIPDMGLFKRNHFHHQGAFTPGAGGLGNPIVPLADSGVSHIHGFRPLYF